MTDLLYDNRQLTDRTALDCHYSKIGTIADVFVDNATGRPEWIAIKTGLFGTKLSFAPLTGAHVYGGDVVIRYDAALVKDAPRVDADGALTADEERELYGHYGIDVRPIGGRDTAKSAARLRKWIETEDVEARLPVQHEKVRVITEPVSDAPPHTTADDFALNRRRRHAQRSRT